MTDQPLPHMTPEQFRRHGHAVIDWIADYWAGIEKHPVLSQVKPGEVAARLPEHPPERGERDDGFATGLLADVDEIVLPGITHWQHPSFFAYFPAPTTGPSVLGDLLSSGLGVQGMLWATSPACTEVETRMMDWMVELLGLPDTYRSDSAGGGVIQDSASSAALVALVAALHRVSGGDVRTNGGAGRFTVYASTETHSSVEKAVAIAGVGTDQLRIVEVDDSLGMRPDRLAATIAADRAAGLTPALVVATIGTTSTTAVDPVRAIGEICRAEGIWLHIDAAYAGAAALCPELRHTHDGVELADSYCTDGHKWLLTNFDCDIFFTSDRSSLVAALSVLPEYLRNAASDSHAVIDYRDWHGPLGRRFRALKLWSVIRWYGAEGLRAHVRQGVGLAAHFADLVRADDRFEIVADHVFSLVCFRLRGADGRNEELLRRLNASGQLYLTHTRVRGAYTLRMAIGAVPTELRHVEAAWQAIQRVADEL
ncbi:pyridoxal-dependent decarboxylase [Fodinicola acaciae]|uniref:pyridoxal-dependent decarboxylase n=1 Tax=Fodinicola acaciae TaxID=2681555 RepID=UPI001C9E3AB4|nr:pyridoxal-dependent decarboxylase [Fodinicola acaciae]